MSLVELQYAEVPLTIGGIGEDSRLLTKQAPRVNTTIEPVLITCTDMRTQHNSVTYIISVCVFYSSSSATSCSNIDSWPLQISALSVAS